MYNRWLAHYQRPGAHWGERNGPPYPLSRQKRFSSDGKKLSDETYLRVTTGRYVKKSTTNKPHVKNGKRWLFNTIDADYDNRPRTEAISERSTKDYVNIKKIQIFDHEVRTDKLVKGNPLANAKILGFKVSRVLNKANNGLPVKTRESTKEEDAKAINPSIGTLTISGNNNCLLCTVAYDMRRRGYNVIARQAAPIEFLYDINEPDLAYMYKNTKLQRGKTLDELTKKLRKEGNSRGAFLARWNGSRAGHCVAYEVEGNKFTIYDAQDGSKYDNPKELFGDAYDFRAIRLDNLEPDYRLIRLAVE